MKHEKTPAEIAAIAVRRACSAMSADGGFRSWLDAKFGSGKWTHADYLPAGFEKNITNHELSDLAVEYGRGRLQSVFGNKTKSQGEDT